MLISPSEPVDLLKIHSTFTKSQIAEYIPNIWAFICIVVSPDRKVTIRMYSRHPFVEGERVQPGHIDFHEESKASQLSRLLLQQWKKPTETRYWPLTLKNPRTFSEWTAAE